MLHGLLVLESQNSIGRGYLGSTGVLRSVLKEEFGTSDTPRPPRNTTILTLESTRKEMRAKK